MNRKLIAVAVAGAMGLPALAVAQSTVQIYGRIHTEMTFTKQGGVSEDQQGNAGGSNIGFRGTERLANGLNAWFQAESSLNGTIGTNANGLADRNSGIGLQGSFGNVLMGNWDLPMKWTTIAGVKIEDTGLFGVANLIHGGAPTNVNNGASAGNLDLTSFYRRQNHTFQYWTPNMSGFEGRIAVTNSNEETAGVNLTPRTWSMGLKYANGPVYVAFGYEKHNDYALSGRDDTGWILSGGYKFGMFDLRALYERKEYESFSATQDAKADAWGLFGNIALGGPHSIQLQYVQAKDTKGTYTGTQASGTATTMVFNGGAGSTGAKQYGIQYTYAFSKRTNVRARYSIIDNESAARYGLYVAGTTASAAGDRNRGFGFAFDHRF